MMSVDLPPPETPVTQVNVPSGISAVTFFRLLPRAPEILSIRPFCGLRRFGGTGTESSPVRYLPVSEFLSPITSAGVPCATISPPWMPAPGPTSTT